MTTLTDTIPGYLAGIWDIDPIHSEVSVVARHFMVTRVRGRFDQLSGVIVTAESPLASLVTATLDAASIDTRNEQRDQHLRSADFLDVEHHPTITFVSTGLRSAGDGLELDGDLTLRGTTRRISLSLEPAGIAVDSYGMTRIGLSARTRINRKDFGVNFNAMLEGGGAVVSDQLDVELNIEAILRDPR